MRAGTRARGRSRAWLAIPAAPLVLLALVVAGPVLAAVVAVLLLQTAWVWPTAPRLADSIAVALQPSSPIVTQGARVRHAVAIVALRWVPATVGIAVLLVALDWGIGAGWDRLRGVDATPSGVRLATTTLPPTTDPRIDSPAFADTPWAERYLAELEALPYTYVPYLGPRERTVHGRYINSADGVRRSYEPTEGGRPALDIWFFGGSTLWGEGQRDDHTIPSDVARLAEREGLTLRVWNFGERGYTAFQEYLFFEQELATRTPPDLAVFYHGANEMSSLLEAPGNLGSQPSMYQLATVADAFHRAPPLPGQAPPETPSVLADYFRTSVLSRVGRALGTIEVPPAEAATGPPYQPSQEAQATAAVEAEQIYRRSMALIHHAADEREVPIQVFWQPAGDLSMARLYRRFSRRVATIGGGVDLSRLLDRRPGPVYIDGVHTNELGASLVADALWDHLRPTVDGLVRG